MPMLVREYVVIWLGIPYVGCVKELGRCAYFFGHPDPRAVLS